MAASWRDSRGCSHRADVALLLLLSLLPLTLQLFFAVRASRLERARIETSSEQSEALHEILTGVLTLRTAGAGGHAVRRWLVRSLEARSASVAIDRLAATARLGIRGSYDALGLCAVVWAGHACLQGTASVGALLSIIMLSERFLGVVASFGGIFTPLLTARSHLARIDALLAIEDDTARSGPKHGSVACDAAVVLDDVWFRHAPDQPWVLRGYSLRAPALAQFALAGPSGFGKTTILRLVAGLYTPERGTVQVFGQAPRQMRAEICYLPQDAHLFQGSIQQNLELLSDGATREALQTAAARNGLAELVATLPMGYDTVLPPGGTTLSGGQRQLIAWTAAMACGRKLLLVDEALSQVDRITRTRLLAMASDAQRTTISVEHERT